MSQVARLVVCWSDATGDGVILRHLVEADRPGYFDWAERRADLSADPAGRPPPVPAELAAA
eukprot:3024824-Alexandrium_andersonii.AAC.1